MKRNLVCLTLIIVPALLAAGCEPPKASVVATQEAPEPPTQTLPSGLKYVDLKEGTGEPARIGDTVDVFYTGWLKDGTRFDSNEGKEPLTVQIGAGGVIRGWEEGLQGMKAGGKRKLIIPPNLAYGAEGKDDVIPPDAELTFRVEVVKVRKP